jgi:hypothetical protein
MVEQVTIAHYGAEKNTMEWSQGRKKKVVNFGFKNSSTKKLQKRCSNRPPFS